MNRIVSKLLFTLAGVCLFWAALSSEVAGHLFMAALFCLNVGILAHICKK